MYKLTTLNNKYSTTRLCYKLLDDEYLNENGKIKEELKFKIKKDEFGIVDSNIPAKEGEKFDTLLFLPEGEGRKGEGGLRTKGYFKFSYEKNNSNWYINTLKTPVNLPITNNQYTNLPLITIITVVYNGEKYLEETIQSVINQTYTNVEYIIIDGGSTDGTLDIIKKYEDYIDYWVSERDEGISDAFNKGVRISLGWFIQILNVGDYLLNNNIGKALLNFFKDQDIMSFQVLTDTNKIFPKYNKNKTTINPYTIKEALENAMVSHQASFISKDVYKNIGLYNLDYKIRMDFDLFLKIQKKYRIHLYNIPIVFYRTDGVSSKLENRIRFKMEEFSALRKLYNLDRSFVLTFFLSLPFYLIKKFISGIYYKLCKI